METREFVGMVYVGEYKARCKLDVVLARTFIRRREEATSLCSGAIRERLEGGFSLAGERCAPGAQRAEDAPEANCSADREEN